MNFIDIPKAKYEWCFNGDWSFRVHRQTWPCWFHRVMQQFCLGIHWRKAQ